MRPKEVSLGCMDTLMAPTPCAVTSIINSVEQIRYAERAYMTGRMGSLAQD